MAYRNFTNYSNTQIPIIQGAKGGKGGGAEPHTPIEHSQDLFSTDILFVVVGVGEGPIYRINPNGPQDIQFSDNSIDDLLNLDGNGLENTKKFKTLSTTGTTTQGRLDVFGEATITPQNFASPVSLKNGSSGIPASGVTLQETSAKDWDSLEKELDLLINLNDEEYYNIHAKNMNFYMSYPLTQTTEEYMSNKINKIINVNT